MSSGDFEKKKCSNCGQYKRVPIMSGSSNCLACGTEIGKPVSKKPTTEETRKEESEGDFWHTANKAFNDKKRREFNKWRHDLYVRADKVRDIVRYLDIVESGREDHGNNKAMNELMDKICEVPILKK